jgi:hypothetical protein
LTVSSNGPFILLQDANNADKVRYISNNTGELQFGIVGDDGATGKTEHMRIDASGSVGIGTDSPSAPLTVAASSGGNNVRLTGRSADGFAFLQYGNNADNVINAEIGVSDAKHMQFFSNSIERMRIASDGNVEMRGSANVRISLGTAGGSGANNTSNWIRGNGDYLQYNSASSGHTWEIGGAEKLRIDSSGRLLVNTAAILGGSAAKLQVLQTVTNEWSTRFNNSSASPYGVAISYVSASPNGTSNQFHYCTDSGGARWGVYSNGGVLNYSGNNVNLSDRNAKKDITLHTDDEWNCVKAWEIVDYRYNDEADDSPTKIGVIAQQIQEHCPDLVNVFQEQADAVEEVLGEDGEVVTEAKAAVEERIGVNEAQMMWKVTKALQEAMERIETLEAKVQTLENN